ncbi:uncharacterized protein BJ171DRAFT_500528 [Polychytrium aggregatum]|uniref:uncharacterized protein n=1 Tax=Polychytrium aggregatum TaxID=110093 RepID=UPI0022FDD410|nr:uncharacterized protein BJ171DRAFT_500528 [Polychytrium aggregatum]KAI9205471.1 hypothetical protein BJ171DRAFT_500528 [Polychytrium aggregatum]
MSSQLFSVSGKVVLVTGGSRGIGLMIAEGFVDAGAKVYISSRSKSVCDAEAARLSAKGPGKCISIPADLQKLEEVHRLVAEIAKREPYLHVLVNNAGATWGEDISSYPDEGFEKVLSLNLKRIFSLIQASLPLLEAAAVPLDPARIINIGSVDGIHVPLLETYAYSASKAGLHHLSRHLASKLGSRYITVNNIAPGPFESKMMKATLESAKDQIVASVPLGRIGSPADMAGVCIYLSSKAGAYVNGATIAVDGGLLVHAKSHI